MNILKVPIETTNSVLKCDGGGGPLGHPLIYLNLGKEKKIICPYCSRYFIQVAEEHKTDR
jgi:uncharacterized Zn-finger protein